MKRTIADMRRRLYKKKRRQLVKDMGGKCAECGYRWRLEFNHLKKRTWVCRQVNRLHRLNLYRAEWLAGVLNLLCRSCNAAYRPQRDSAEWRDEVEGPEDAPF